MCEITVIAQAFTNDVSLYKCLSDTAAKFGAPLTMMGAGRPYPGFVNCIPIAIEAIEACSAPYILLTDGYDTMFCRWDAAEAIDLIEQQPGKLLMSCQADCWPSGPWCYAYPTDNRWGWINGGQFCGEREAMLKLLRTMLTYTDEHGGTTQERLHKMYADRYPMGLDTRCQVFQSMSNPAYGIEWRDGVLNTVEDTRPMLLHFNGQTPGLQCWYEKVMG